MKSTMGSVSSDVEFLWASCRLRDASCFGLVHSGPAHCLRAFLQKLIDTGYVGAKYYIIFHLMPFLIRAQSSKKCKQTLNMLPVTCLNYVRSLLFMAFLVGLLRGALCVSMGQPQHRIPKPQIIITLGSILSSVSILLEHSSRRNEITYFVCAKAIRSGYVGVKRMAGWSWKAESYVMQVVMMSALYYLYNHQHSFLHFRGAFEYIFGEN